MGTNYYIRKAIRPSKLKELKRLVTEDNIYNGTLQEALNEFQEIHVGKSSYGWQFCFDHNNGKYYDKSKESINRFLEDALADGGSFMNEYDELVSVKDFWEMVNSKKDGFNQKTNYQYELGQWERYQSNPEEFEGCLLKPVKPSDYSKEYPETITDEGLRFAYFTDFC